MTNENQKMNLEEKLAHLTQDNAKAKLIEKSMRAGEQVETKYVDLVFTQYEKRKDLEKAVLLAIEIDDSAHAVKYMKSMDQLEYGIKEVLKREEQNYEPIENPIDEISILSHRHAKERMIKGGIAGNYQSENYGLAAEIAFEFNRKELARILYKKEMSKKNPFENDTLQYAGELADRLGFFEDAVMFYEKGGFLIEAIESSKQTNDRKKLCELLLKLAQQEPNKPEYLTEAIGVPMINGFSELYKKAVNVGLERAEIRGDYGLAADYAKILGQTQKAEVFRELAN